ncbi:T9SS type A sorting domain-containing protein [Cytophagaceae bacterium DM2B3-1]|uniref:T9SS type A sorting domain-containing protein n=1 Tax=Xanthocytophaga flava TaxID=3048013 RepID=A0ABT7CH86_9BACT|nr:T9SS type A sorting domain-containing protein [Xanthocytophaga flavus]MDJ1493096.1 T9SS type A sorting domain-containing protein [Xanthocytophaga flavus]
MYHATLFFITAALLIANTASIFAQKQANNWYFGHHAGLNFFTRNPQILLTSAMDTTEGSAVISDEIDGRLLFYTNGLTVWNKEHQPMNNTSVPVNCGARFYQSAIIIPVPDSKQEYYIFSVPTLAPDYPQACYPSENKGDDVQLFYMRIDMTQNQGKGGVAQPLTFLQNNVTYKLTAIPHSNKRDYWILTHAWNSDAFYAYPITSNGIGAPVITHIGSPHLANENSGDDERIGCIKASPDGTKVACSVFNQAVARPFDLFDFNATTGVLTNHHTLGNLYLQGGLSFSPDNSKLYVQMNKAENTNSHPNTKDLIYQYDLSAGSVEAIRNSGHSIIVGNKAIGETGRTSLSTFALQLAPDGRLYAPFADVVGEISSKRMIVINSPNALGYACNVQIVNFSFKEDGIWSGLPNFMESYFDNLLSTPIGEDDCEKTSFKILPNPTTGKVKIETGQCIQPFNVSVYDLLGRSLLDISITDSTLSTIELDISDYAEGLYIFDIHLLKDKKNIIKKVVKF